MTAHLKHSSSLFFLFIFTFLLFIYSVIHCKSYLLSALTYESLFAGSLFYPAQNHSQEFEDYQLVSWCVQA